MPQIESIFLVALVTTVLIELIVLVLVVRFLFSNQTLSLCRLLITGTLCSFATLPYFWFIFPGFLNESFYLPVGEVVVTIIEAGILELVLRLGYLRSLTASALCNIVSFIGGELLMNFVLDVLGI